MLAFGGLRGAVNQDGVGGSVREATRKDDSPRPDVEVEPPLPKRRPPTPPEHGEEWHG